VVIAGSPPEAELPVKINLCPQIHEFTEEGRPLSYSLEAYIPDCQYGVLNSREYNFLLKAGIEAEALHIIPYMV
jgi:hypothetical protein